MPFTSINDIEAKLRSDDVKARDLHQMWDQRQPAVTAARGGNVKGPRTEGKQIAWLQDDSELGVLFTTHALRSEEFLLVCDGAREVIHIWQNGSEDDKTNVVRVRRNLAEALTRLGSTRDARRELQPTAAEDFQPRLSRKFRADIFLQLGDILREQAQHATAHAVRLQTAQQALEFYEQGLALDPDRPDALSRTAAASLVLGEDGSTLRAKAHEIARRLLELTAKLEDAEGPRKDRTRARATAHAVLGDVDAAAATYQAYVQMQGVETRELADARFYAKFLAEALGKPRDFFDKAFPPLQLVVFAGHMPDAREHLTPRRFPPSLIDPVRKAIAAALDEHDVRVGMACAAAGADLLFIDALLARKGTVHVVLPWAKAEFLETSVRAFERAGGDPVWEPMFNRALEQAASVREMSQSYLPKSEVGWGYVTEVTAGMALHLGRTSRLDTQPMVLWDGQNTGGNRGTSFFYNLWHHVLPNKPIIVNMPKVEGVAPPPLEVGPNRRSERSTLHQEVKSMLFADIVGYSKLKEHVIQEFVETFLERVSQLVSTSKHRPRALNTWGDAVYAVFDFAHDAGCFALELTQMIKEGEKDWIAKGLSWEDTPEGGGPAKLKPLNIRVGLHTGPVYMHHDPVVRRLGFTGAHVNRAARIEPIAIPGEVFASEEFAAMAELGKGLKDDTSREDSADFACEYAGSMHLAKNYPGRFRIYRVLPQRVFAIEDLAKAAHASFIEESRARGETVETNPSMRPWDELPEDLKGANRAQVADIPNKLHFLGYELAPSHGLLPSEVRMTDEQVETLSIREHDRWMQNRLDRGWTYGPARDNVRKLHPLIVPWDDLSEPEKQKDRDTVRNLPMLIQRAGFRVRKLATTK